MTHVFAIGLDSLIFLMKQIEPVITIGDMKEAANALTVPFDKVCDYVHGQCIDSDLTYSLIAFFTRRIEARYE